jgi:hypothetical protein
MAASASPMVATDVALGMGRERGCRRSASGAGFTGVVVMGSSRRGAAGSLESVSGDPEARAAGEHHTVAADGRAVPRPGSAGRPARSGLGASRPMGGRRARPLVPSDA